MMENHSFDNYLGTLGRGDGLPDPAPANRSLDGKEVGAYHFDTTLQRRDVPSQSWRASHEQYGEGRNDGFVTSIERLDPRADATLGMGHWNDRDLPFYSALARTFPLAERWFCSCLGPTFPNRRFLIAGTANGLIDDVLAGVVDYPATGTIFDLLDQHGIWWVNYHHVPPFKLLSRRLGGEQLLRAGRAITLASRHLLPSTEATVRGEIQCTANLYPLGLLKTIGHLKPVEEFFASAAAGTLPAVSFVDPDFTCGSEENPQDVQIGEGFAASVIEAVMRGANWDRTVLIWLYDEHGGYYDHVPPPAAVEPDDVLPHSLLDAPGPIGWLVRNSGFGQRLKALDATPGRYDRYGFRVPAVVVSPYAKRDYVSSTVFDHTSVLRLIEEKWNLPPLTRRDAAATAPWDLLDLDSDPAFLRPPNLARPARPWRERAD
jgi:phospholipase C